MMPRAKANGVHKRVNIDALRLVRGWIEVRLFNGSSQQNFNSLPKAGYVCVIAVAGPPSADDCVQMRVFQGEFEGLVLHEETVVVGRWILVASSANAAMPRDVYRQIAQKFYDAWRRITTRLKEAFRICRFLTFPQGERHRPLRVVRDGRSPATSIRP